VSRNRFCDFLADPDSRIFSRFGAIMMQLAVCFHLTNKALYFGRRRSDWFAMTRSGFV
jgi:hypothetical protein